MRMLVWGVMIMTLAGCSNMQSGGSDSAFSNTRVDFGIVVSDIDAAACFYKNALGLTEVEGFSVPAAMGGDSGLSDHHPFDVRRFQIDGAPQATEVKIMQFPDAPGKKVDNTFIHSSLGISYLTFYVTDMTAAVERAERAGVKPLANGPVRLANGQYLALVRDPDGNMIELVGPKKE